METATHPTLLDRMSAAISAVFDAPLQAFFHPINSLFSPIPPIWWIVSAVGLFTAAMLWVWFGLRKEYVNLDAPGDKPWHDLRWWTVVSMTPHVLIYIYFNL